MKRLSKGAQERLMRTISTLTAITTILSLSGVALIAPAAIAAKPSDYGLKEGDVISAAGSDDPDVYIVNEQGYKRLFLNPAIFGFYGHLGGFAAVKNVSATTRDAFPTSGLFRNCETNDPKVYGVESTGEDVGMLHWVNTSGAQAVADDPNFFSKVFCINNNEFSWYSKGSDYTSVNQVPNYTRAPGQTPTGPVSASLAPTNPTAKTITTNATGETLMVIRLSGSGTVNQLVFKRMGAGATGDYDNLYLYEGARRLTSGRAPSTADGTVTFSNLSLVAGKDISLVADHSATAGNVNFWQLQSGMLTGSGTLGGTPINSANFTVSGAASGTLTVEKSGSVSDIQVGQQNAQVSEFKLTASTEAAWVRRIQLFNGGTVKATDISNLRLEVNGVQVATGTMTADGYAVFDFGMTGYKIDKGNNRIFKVFANVAGKKDETVLFYMEQAADGYAVGDQFGFGMGVSLNTNFDDSAATHQVTLDGGVLTITFNGPTATNVGTDTSDSVLAEFAFTAVSQIEAKRLRLILCADIAGDGTFDALDTNFSDLEDIKVMDIASGATVLGPIDGSSFSTAATAACPGGFDGLSYLFTDTFDLSGTRNFRVSADVQTDNSSDSSTALSAASVFKVILDGYGASDLASTNGSLSVMKYAGTNTAVAGTDIAPNSDLSGNNMTVQSSALTLGLASTPGDTTYVKGQQGVDSAGFTLGASLGSDIKITTVKLSGFVADSGSTLTLGVGSGVDSSLSVGNLVSNVMLYDGSTGTLISSSPSGNNLNNSTGTIQFTNLNWTIPAGQTKNLLVKVNLSSNSTSGSSDVFSFDIASTADITGIDNNSNTVNPGTEDPNGGVSANTIITVSNAGSLTVTAAPANPITEAKYWGQQDTEFARYRVRATNDAFLIERLNLFNSADTAGDVTSNIDKVKIQYTNKAGATLTQIGTLNGDTRPSVSFGFTGDNRPYVPKDSSADIIVMANLKTKAQGATSEVAFGLDFSGGAADEFRAVGEGSGVVIDGAPTSDSTVANVLGNDMYIYRVFPKITKETVTAGEPLGTKDVLKFTIKAEGLADSKILFDTDTASGAILFEAVASGTLADTAMVFNLYNVATGELLASRSVTGLQDSASVNSSVSFNDWERDFEIQGGTSVTFRVETSFVNFTSASDYLQLVLRDESGVLKYVDGARSGEDQTVTNVAGAFKLLPMLGETFTKN